METFVSIHQFSLKDWEIEDIHDVRTLYSTGPILLGYRNTMSALYFCPAKHCSGSSYYSLLSEREKSQTCWSFKVALFLKIIHLFERQREKELSCCFTIHA